MMDEERHQTHHNTHAHASNQKLFHHQKCIKLLRCVDYGSTLW